MLNICKFCVVGIFYVAAYAGKWPLQNVICPQHNFETHECFEMIHENSTCAAVSVEVNNCTIGKCRFTINSEMKSCIVYKCSERFCCEDYTRNVDGDCVKETDKLSKQCKNGGTLLPNGFCECSEQFAGKYCETTICKLKCLNGGECQVFNKVPVCVCPSTMYSGPQCETITCSDLCLNGGKCVKDGVLARCECLFGYQGNQCQFAVDQQRNCPIMIAGSYNPSYCESHKRECEKDRDCSQNINGKTICCYDGCSSVCAHPATQGCSYQGRMYEAGEMFSPSSCERCVCQIWGAVKCTNISYYQYCTGDQTPIFFEDQCCTVCQGQEIIEMEEPTIKNCPVKYVTINVSKNSDIAVLPRLDLVTEGVFGSNISVMYSEHSFVHSKSSDIVNNIHIISAISQCDSRGRRVVCRFTVIVRDSTPPIFKTCPTNIYAKSNEKIWWVEPNVSDNVGILHTQVDGNDLQGKILAEGVYRVSYTAFDFDQNQAICTFLIIVNDAHIESISAQWHEHEQQQFPMATIMGFLLGVGLALFLAIFVIVRSRRIQMCTINTAMEHRQQVTNIFTIFSNSQSNINLMETKLPNLPYYNLPRNPPTYEEIQYVNAKPEEYTEMPIYEEIQNRLPSRENSHDYANIATGGINNHNYENDKIALCL